MLSQAGCDVNALCSLFHVIKPCLVLAMLFDVCVDNYVGQSLNKCKKFCDVRVGHADGFLAEQFSYLLDSQCHLPVGNPTGLADVA